MTATKQDIIRWIENAKSLNATHLIVAVDQYDFENYPVYITEDKDVKEEYERITNSNMQGIDEVYDMSMDIDKQLQEHRAFHF